MCNNLRAKQPIWWETCSKTDVSSYPCRGPLIFRNSTVITAQVVETLGTVNDGPIQDCTNLDDHIPPVMTPGFKPFTVLPRNFVMCCFHPFSFYLWLCHSLSHVTESGVNLLPKVLSLWVTIFFLQNLNQNKRTLLPKFFGLYCYQVMNFFKFDYCLHAKTFMLL